MALEVAQPRADALSVDASRSASREVSLAHLDKEDICADAQNGEFS